MKVEKTVKTDQFVTERWIHKDEVEKTVKTDRFVIERKIDKDEVELIETYTDNWAVFVESKEFESGAWGRRKTEEDEQLILKAISFDFYFSKKQSNRVAAVWLLYI